jgi:thioredoxin 1
MIDIKTVEDFDNCVKDNDVFVVKFWASWCGPCRAMKPIFEKISEDTEGAAFADIDIEVEETQEIAVRYGIMNIPAVLIFKGGELADTAIGLQSENDLREKIVSCI